MNMGGKAAVSRRRRIAWLVFDIVGWIMYLDACCVWLIPGLQPAPAPAALLTVQEAR